MHDIYGILNNIVIIILKKNIELVLSYHCYVVKKYIKCIRINII